MKVRIRVQSNKGGIVVEIFWRPPDQEYDVEKVFRQLEEVIWSHAQILMWKYDYPNVCKKDNIGEHEQTRRFQSDSVDNFLWS